MLSRGPAGRHLICWTTFTTKYFRKLYMSDGAILRKHTKAYIKHEDAFFSRRCVANVWNGMRHSGLPALIQQKLLTVLNTSRFLLHCWNKVCLSRIAFFSGLCIANKLTLDHIAGLNGKCGATPDSSWEMDA